MKNDYKITTRAILKKGGHDGFNSVTDSAIEYTTGCNKIGILGQRPACTLSSNCVKLSKDEVLTAIKFMLDMGFITREDF